MNTVLAEVQQMTEAAFTRVRWALGLSGALSVALGIAIIVWPDISLFTLVILFGIVMFSEPGEGALALLALIAAYALISGIAELAVGIGGKRILSRAIRDYEPSSSQPSPSN